MAGRWPHTAQSCAQPPLVPGVPCPMVNCVSPMAPEESIVRDVHVLCWHRTLPYPMTRLAWGYGLTYTLHGRHVSPGYPAVARQCALQAYSFQPFASAQETAHGRDTYVWTLC
jgi:hypothetical protein